ncbi:hypothetical protein HFP72_14040 [Nocardiopsis sp. ARC36]
MTSSSPRTRPKARAAEEARRTLSAESRTTAEEGSAERTSAIPGGRVVPSWRWGTGA